MDAPVPTSHRRPRRLAPLLSELRNQRLGSFSDCTRRRCSAIHASASALVANALTLAGWVSGIVTSMANAPSPKGITRYVASAWGCVLATGLIFQTVIAGLLSPTPPR